VTTLALGIPTVTFPDPSGVTAAIPATTMVAPAVPATTVTASNTTNQPYTVVVTDNGAVYSAVLVNGVSVTVTDTYLVPAYGAFPWPIRADLRLGLGQPLEARSARQL